MGLRAFPFSSIATPQRVRIIVADPYPVILHGIRKMIENDPRFEVVADVSTMPSLLKKIIADPPEVALVDWSMASQDLATVTALVQSSLRKTSFLFLTVSQNSAEKRQMIKSAASGFVNKWCSGTRLRNAVSKACEGRLSPRDPLTEMGLEAARLENSDTALELQRIERLTQRERQLLPMVCGGLKNKEIALCLGIAETTVWHHLTAIFTKLQVADRVGLVRFSYRHNMVNPNDISGDRFHNVESRTG
jgi:DNA-binding NarL/FixJ family response regulator